MPSGRPGFLKIAIYSAAGLCLVFMLFVVIFSGTVEHRLFPDTGSGPQWSIRLMTLENFALLSATVFCAGIIGLLVKANLYSIAAISISSIIGLAGFAFFWRGAEWIAAVVLILIVMAAGVIVTHGLLREKGR